jgi:hypothetical protein
VEAALLIIVKVWREHDGRLRASVTHAADLLHDRPTQSYATSRDEVLAIIRDQLEHWGDSTRWPPPPNGNTGRRRDGDATTG